MEGLESLGLIDNTITKRKEHGAILNIHGDDGLFNYLEGNNVCCSQRGGGIRLSFHLYNTETEIDNILDILKTAPSSLITRKK